METNRDKQVFNRANRLANYLRVLAAVALIVLGSMKKSSTSDRAQSKESDSAAITTVQTAVKG